MRSLSPYIQALIETSPRFRPALTLAPSEVIVVSATCLIGINEASSLPLVDAIRSTIAKPDHEPWCMDFAQTCIAFAEYAKKLKSPVFASESVLETWKNSVSAVTGQPKRGDLILWRKRDAPTEGHCGIIIAADALLYHTIEGNTSDTKDIDRNGRGVCQKARTRGGTATFEEVGFLRCFSSPA